MALFVVFPDSLAGGGGLADWIAQLGLEREPLVVGQASGSVNAFSSVTHLLLHVCRLQKWVSHDRISLLGIRDFYQQINLLVSTRNQQNFDSFEAEVSDVLDLVRRIEARLPNDAEVQDFHRVLQATKMLDRSSLQRLLPASERIESLPPIIVINPDLAERSREWEFLHQLAQAPPQIIQVATSLDASLHGGLEPTPEVHLTPLADISRAESAAKFQGQSLSPSVAYCLGWMEAILRLLVNSRDELALAKVMCGPCGFIDHKAFTNLKHEARRVNMPLYQTVISYVGKLKLGGKSYAPTPDHPFYAWNKELSDFEALMDKLQSRIEDTRDQEEVGKKLVQVLKSFALKSENLRKARIEECTQIMEEIFDSYCQASQVFKASGTPTRTVGSGGSVRGRNNMKVLRHVVDHLTCASDQFNLHAVLEKVDQEAAVLNQGVATTPLSVPSLAKLYTSPPEEEVDPIESTAPVLEAKINCDATPKTKRGRATGRPKYGATLSWAQETSPVILESPEMMISSQGRVFAEGVTLAGAAASDPPTRNHTKRKLNDAVDELIEDVEQCINGARLKQAAEAVDEAVKQMKVVKKPPRKVAKRSILKDIANLKTPSVLASLEPQIKSLSKTKSEEPLIRKQKKVPVPKGPKTKAPPPLIKGQTKLTSYFRI
eukprot:maker-scaffold266_size231069-snap-gene-1.23 protein:Tk11999 transcript:maker-scaffold266_size231069-snap-gene-1.23-mRNA-1 annotation:"hypothetical protein BRAFLDRAFT_88535"